MLSLVLEQKTKLVGSILIVVTVIHATTVIVNWQTNLGKTPQFKFGAERLSEDGESNTYRSRLRPRHLLQTEVRGATYHVHGPKVTDKVVKETYTRWRRNVEALRPRYIARKTISDSGPEASGNEFYKAVSGEVGNLRLKCGSCAIVGSAGTLTEAKAGSSVDASDCVFRLGLAPVTGFEQDVGAKTTVRIVDGKSFSELVKHPQKLVTGSLSSTHWVIFDHNQEVDTLKLALHMRSLRRTIPELTVYTITRRGENQAFTDMKESAGQLKYKLPNDHPSTLWYSIQAAQESGCSNITVLGVPDPKFCKRDEPKTWSRYWGLNQPPLCSNGKDSGSIGSSAELQLISLGDRRALLGLTTTRPDIKFGAPTWPVQL